MHNTTSNPLTEGLTGPFGKDVGFHSSSIACRSARCFGTKAIWIVFMLNILLANTDNTHASPLHFEKSFTLFDTFGQTPHAVTNAFIRVENFGPLTRYWQPTAPNMLGEAVYKFELPGATVSANFDAHMGVYNGHSIPAFDPGAAGWLDVSADGVHWTTLFDSNLSSSSTYDANHEDITSYVQGASIIFFRARLFMTTNPAGFGCSQFMRVNGDGGGYAPFTLRADLAAVPELDPTGIDAALALVASAFVLLDRRRLMRA